MDKPGSILITGASGGIGAALALDYAAPGIFYG
jgi:NAD(P)-dependent dehydrogenase (short-subunit alcohol dehydrogenase family)